MSQSSKVLKNYGALNISGTTLTVEDDALNIGNTDVGNVVGPSSSTANAVARYSDTAGKTVKNSPITISDSGTLASTGNINVSAGGTGVSALTLTSAGGLTVSASSLAFPKASVTQATSITTGVTINTPAGEIVTVSATTAAGATSTFTVSNSSVLTSSQIQVTTLYAGTLGTGGIPYVTVNNVASGAFNINITNIHDTNALNAAVKIHYIVY